MSIPSVLAAPSYLWNFYLRYLWNYDSNSWVAAIAYAFRIWAIFAIFPTLVLGLLDVTSYVIARTLGDPTASTSHKSSFASQSHPNSEPKNPIANTGTDTAQTAVPATATAPDSIPIEVLPPQDETPPSGASSTKPPTPLRGRGRVVPGGTTTTTTTSTSSSSLPAFFVDGEEGSEDDGAARLAGVGVFSPVASMPGSPVVSRRNILEKEREEHGSHERSASDGGGGGGGSTSGESSFALLDREESFEDAGAHIRRRVPGTTGADE